MAKPIGQRMIEWCHRWDAADHEGKVELCKEFEVTYETGRHWRSDSSVPTLVKEVEADKEGGWIDLPDEFLGGNGVNLDFVSFDLETTNLTADFSAVLCACIKPFGREPMVFRADDFNPDWASKRMDDEALVKAIAAELATHAIVITHYGIGFDIPYLRAKMMKYGLPPLPPMFGIDTYSIAKNNFRVSSRRLKNLARYFELGKLKHEVEGNLWMRAGMNGDVKALDEIVKHNVRDCELLEKLASRSFLYLKSIRRL